jgi:type II secretory pathway predicted ATPase ExeA
VRQARAIGLLSGESGAGKTVAARAAIAALDQTRHTLIYLANPTTGARGICHHVVTSLGGVPRFQNAALYPQAADALAAENTERGRLPVLIIDEAHLLDHDQLELVRMLTNAEMDAASPLAVILVGQPTLKRMMKLGVLAALDQRVAVRYTLGGMTGAETANYISHHLKLAGRSDTLLSDDAVALIHQTSRGYPRVVNNLAVHALLAAFADGKAIVDESSTRTAIAELTTTD